MKTSITWKPIKGFEDLYAINSDGVVMSNNQLLKNKKGARRFRIGKIIKVFIDRSGYPVVKLSKNSVDFSRYVHRLVAESFVENLGNKPFVNHISGDKLDFTIGNLEWVTASEHRMYAINTGLSKAPFVSTPVINICTGEKFASIVETATFTK